MEPESFVLSATLLLAVSAIAVAVFKHIGLGSVLGLLVAGIVVGPHSPGPHVTTEVEAVRQFTELGVVLLLFLIGLEIKPGRLWEMRRQVFGLGSMQILVSGLAIGFYAQFYVGTWQTALLMGLSLALSSTAFVMQILQERGEFASVHGRASFAVLLMQDLAIVPLLALVPILSDKGTLSAEVPLWEQLLIVVGMLGLVWVFGRYVIPPSLERLTRQRNREGFLLVIMLAVFLAAWAMHEAGLSMALGAFLMGMMLSGSRYNYQIQAAVEPYKGLLMSLFFVAVGMSIDIGALSERPLTFAQHVAAIVLIKLVVLYGLALAFGLGRSVAVRVAFYLAQSGEFGFVLFGSAKVLGVIDDATFALAVGVISVSMLITPLLVRGGDRLARRFRAEEGPQEGYRYELGGAESSARVVIGGYGRVGHTVATLLEASGVPYIAFDTDPGRVAEGKADGRPVYYGDIADPELLASAGAGKADLIVLTVDHSRTALRTVSHVRSHFPRVPIIARARDLVACDHLITAGATQAYPEAVEASLRLGAEALKAIGVAGENVDQMLYGVRSSNYALVRDEQDGGGGRAGSAARERSPKAHEG
jgi:glutathione-regulated potassium-efflux system protein KefB